MIGALWVGTRQFVHERSGLPPPSLASPSFIFDDPIRTTQHLLDRVYSLIPLAFRPAHIAPLSPPPIIQGCFRNYVHSRLLTLEREGFPIYYGHTHVTSHAVAAQSTLAVFPPTSSLPRTLHKFQSLVSRPPNCYIQFKLCACGSVHGHLISLTDLDAGTPLYVGDPPVDHLDFVIQFDGGAFREHRVGGAGIVLWKHTTQGLTLLDTFAVPLFPCPDAAYAETVGAAHAVLMAARHFPLHRPSRILIKGDNRPIIDFMNSVGKLRRPDLQKLLTEAQHALAFSLPPLIWSYTPREFNKCADFLAGIARDYAKQSLTPDLLPYSLSPFVFPLPPSLSPLYSPPPPLTLSPPSSAFTFQESPDFPLSVFPQLARKAAQFPPLQRYLRALQNGPSSIPTICLVAPILKLTLQGPITNSFNVLPPLSLASPFPLLINLGTYLRKILSLLILAFLYIILLLLRTCPPSFSIPLLKLLFYIIVVRDIGLLSLFEKFYIRSLKPNPASLRPLTPALGPVPCPLLHQLTSSFILWNILRPFGSNLSPLIFCPITPLLVLFGFMMGYGSLLPHHHH